MTSLEKTRLEIQADIEEAQALADHPHLLRLRELQPLEKMATSGACFAGGLGRDGLKEFFHDQETL